MRARRVGCLPAGEGGALVGIVAATDFLEASAKLFEERLTPKVAPPEIARGAHQAVCAHQAV